MTEIPRGGEREVIIYYTTVTCGNNKEKVPVREMWKSSHYNYSIKVSRLSSLIKNGEF